MNTVLVYFKNSYTVLILAVILSVIFTTISGAVNEETLTKDDYLRAMVLTSLVSILIIYINKIPGNLTEEVITGIAPF